MTDKYKECKFEYSVECEKISDCEYTTGKEAIEAANERFQEICEDEDGYQYGRGDAVIYCIDASSGEVLMQTDIRVYSEREMRVEQVGGR